MDGINKEKQCLREKGKMRLIYGDVTLGVRSFASEGGSSGEEKEFHYIFSYAAGGPVSFVIGGKEWLYRSPRPTFWRAVTDNDRGNGFPLKSGMWMAADMFLKCVSIKVSVDGTEIPMPCAPENNRYSGQETAKRMQMVYTYETITVPKTEVQVAYDVDSSGEITVSVHYFGKKGLPQLPVFGMRFLIPTCAEGFRYQGLSGETYPDRRAGGIPGIYETEGLPVTPYLVPQDCGMHMDTSWVEIRRKETLDNRRYKTEKKETALRVEAAEENFAFSCLPYTAEELENATHQEELPPARRTVLCIYGAVRGVGGIDSWGSDVEPEYQIDAEKDIAFSFRITNASF